MGPVWLNNVENWPTRTNDCPLVFMGELPIDHSEVEELNPPIISVERFSSYYKLINVTNHVLNFVYKLVPSFKPKITGEVYWIKRAQSEYYPNVLHCLRSGSKERKHQASLKFIQDLTLYLCLEKNFGFPKEDL